MSWFSSTFDWEKHRAEMAKERAHARDLARTRQAEVDAEADPAKRLELQRKRYKCGSRYVRPESLHRYSEVVEKLRTLPNNTTCATAHSGFSSRGLWAMPNDLAIPSAEDCLRRMPVNVQLNKHICLYVGDITALEVDAIVNAANTSLLGGGGIDGAIHSAAGSLLVEECEALDGCETGDTKITRGYALPAKHVLHTVGPMGRGDRELRSCYRTCLELVEKHRLRTVAFCCVGTGIYGFPLIRATHIALSETRKWLDKLAARKATDQDADPSDEGAAPAGDHAGEAPASKPYTLADLDRIIFCCFKDSELMAYERIAPAYFPIEGFPTQAKEQQPDGEEEFNEDNGQSYASDYHKDKYSELDGGAVGHGNWGPADGGSDPYHAGANERFRSDY
jgi:O-acetyl-ADP-ribose deacetylase (regulator of RNase III)